MLNGIKEYRRAVADIVRRERRNYDLPIKAELVDIDVGPYNTLIGIEEAEGVDSQEHRRLAMEARVDVWRNIRAGELENNPDALIAFEEFSHTE